LSNLSRKVLNSNLNKAIKGLEIYPADHRLPIKIKTVKGLRRGRPRPIKEELSSLSLIEKSGVLQWVDDLGFSGRGKEPSRRGRGDGAKKNIVTQLKFRSLEPSQIGNTLEKLDIKLNKQRGLRQWSSINSAVGAQPVPKGKILLFIHGTFSSSEGAFKGISLNPDGTPFIAKILNKYDQILSFDHPTLSVSPILNALDLERAFEGSKAKVDIICHSRGGLVARWWGEVLNKFPGRFGKVIFVGSPLGGTSLAAPPKLRYTLNYLTNVAEAIGVGSKIASSAVPIFSFVTVLLKILSSITRIGAKTPLIDAAIAMIPGLVAQSRVGDNFPLEKLREGIDPTFSQKYFSIRSNFEPTAPEWKFWEYFNDPLTRVADYGADAIFRDDNDLVVDSISMAELSDKQNIPMTRTHNFGTNAIVHHLNYFEQPETLKFILKSLKIP